MSSDHTYSALCVATPEEADGRVFQFAAVRLHCSGLYLAKETAQIQHTLKNEPGI